MKKSIKRVSKIVLLLALVFSLTFAAVEPQPVSAYSSTTNTTCMHRMAWRYIPYAYGVAAFQRVDYCAVCGMVFGTSTVAGAIPCSSSWDSTLAYLITGKP